MYALGDISAHVDLLARAVVVGGLASEAVKDLRGLADRPTLSKLYVDALGRFARRAELDHPSRVAGYREMARAYAESLGMGA
ncbi:MAG TPA: hypothetical protein PKD61_37535, partial [Polyangiaceae bacterium]|nr:hypothetical protein [Polyangiaceae bacterium]